MLKLFAAFLLALNPLSGIFNGGIPALVGNTGKNLAPSSAPANKAGQFFELPVQENAFLDIRQLPIYPMRNWSIEEPDIAAKTALAIDTSRNQILYQKNDIFEQRPIASLTKLMTALVTIDNAPLDSVIKISPTAVAAEGDMGSLRVGEELTVKNLLYALLVNSSNDAATALAENIPIRSNESNLSSSTDATLEFIKLMNEKAGQLELKNTFFVDSSGLSPKNYSCAWDISRMLQKATINPVLREIMKTQSIDLRSTDGKFNHHLVNTNKLLGIIPEIIGAKTGYTEEAGNCMALAARTPENKEMIIIVVMDAQNRLEETRTLFEWTKKGFVW